MALQQIVRADQTTGLPGEFARKGPERADPWILLSDPEINQFGHAFTQVSDGNAQVGGDISGGVPFVGILMRPKEHALVGSGSGSSFTSSALTATFFLADGEVGQLAMMGILYVQLVDDGGQAVAGVVGTALFFDDTTGAISAGTAGGGQSVIPNAEIAIEDVAVDGLAIIRLTN